MGITIEHLFFQLMMILVGAVLTLLVNRLVVIRETKKRHKKLTQRISRELTTLFFVVDEILRAQSGSLRGDVTKIWIRDFHGEKRIFEMMLDSYDKVLDVQKFMKEIIEDFLKSIDRILSNQRIYIKESNPTVQK